MDKHSVVGKLVRLPRMIALLFLLPATLNFFAYYGFISGYTSRVFSEESFLRQYDKGVYKYRVLAKESLLEVHDFMKDHTPPLIHWRLLAFLDKNGDHHFYDSYYALNTIFLCFTSAVLLLIFSLPVFRMPEREKHLWVALLTSFIVLSQFVIVPYDTMSYFFICLGMYIILLDKQNLLSLLALCVVVIFGTLTRESSALILSFLATVHVIKRGFQLTPLLKSLALPLAAYLATYYALRIIYGFEESSATVTLSRNFQLRGLISIAFFLSAVSIIVLGARNLKACLIYLLFCSPYLYQIFKFGILWEIRLWIPLILAIAVITALEDNRQESDDTLGEKAQMRKLG